MKKIAFILGTRPEIIKLSPVIRECQKRRLNYFILHTNQHYSSKLDKIFFDELELPRPRYNLRVGSGTHAEETGKMLIGIERVLMKENPDIVLVQGDTNTVLAGALAASKVRIKIGHIEAGLRSYDRKMPEELNRMCADHLSDWLFAPTKRAKEILVSEGIPKRDIFVTGNTIVDAVYQNLALAERKSRILTRLNLEKDSYFLLTIHRPENVDERKRLMGILTGLSLIHQKFNMPIIFSVHPRTIKMINTFKLKVPAGVTCIEPVGFLDFLKLESNAKLVLTDSGGIQEEACILNIPCVTLRDNTERPETLEIGSNILAGVRQDKIVRAVKKMLHKPRRWKNPFGDGKSAQRIIKVLTKNFSRA